MPPPVRRASFSNSKASGPADFNSYGSRRGNDRVMTRGTFANIRIRNQLAPGTEGGVTRHLPDGQAMSVYEAAMKYQEEGTPLVVLAGKEYGTGSSRDWAAKGTQLLGVRAVIATSFERIHRSNLVGMGVLPLELAEGRSWQELGLTGEETFDIPVDEKTLKPGVEMDRPGHRVRRRGQGVLRPGSHRHAGRARLLPQRWNSTNGCCGSWLRQSEITENSGVMPTLAVGMFSDVSAGPWRLSPDRVPPVLEPVSR